MWGGNGLNLGSIAMGGDKRHTDDSRGGAFIGHSRWIQHVDSSGAVLWGADGATYTTVSSGFTNSVQVHDQRQGVFNIWAYYLGGLTSNDVYSQYIDQTGSPRSGSIGTPVCKTAGIQDWPDATIDGNGGAIAVWDDFRDGYSNIYSAKIDSAGIVTSIGVILEQEYFPKTPFLRQNHPNPFNPETTISFYLPFRAHTRLSVIDILGHEVKTLLDSAMDEGLHSLQFNGENLASGVYFCWLVADGQIITKKMVLLR